MIKVGITGQNGFIGSHLYNTLGLYPDEFEQIDFKKEYFIDTTELDQFVSRCDIIVHLAAVNRAVSETELYDTNVRLVKDLIDSLNRTNSKAHVLISSSTQEARDNLYGRSKKEGRELLKKWAEDKGGKFTGLIIPNVFGAFGKPFYNSFIATFCYQLTHNQTPKVEHNGEVQLICVQELVNKMIEEIRSGVSKPELMIKATATKKVSEVLSAIEYYKTTYFEGGEIPQLKSSFEHNLFNTFRSYIELQDYFPRKFVQHKDPRGVFVEIIRLGIGGQCSFSTTVPGITRGNHYHTRKIERFAVIKGKALIQLRKVNKGQIFNFELNGDEPAYVDMPIWFTHNIKNVGDEDLYTIFWIDEPFDPEDPDTYFLDI